MCGKNGASSNLQRCHKASGDTLKWKINVNVKTPPIKEGADVKKPQTGYSQTGSVKCVHLHLQKTHLRGPEPENQII